MGEAKPPSGLADTLPAGGSVEDVPAHVSSPGLVLSRGAQLGRYIVIDRLGGGGMGVVYAAYDPDLGRKVAIKLMRPELTGSRSGSDGAVRMLREAQAMARLSHPNVIPVHDVGEIDGQIFLAMELVEGRTLDDWCKETPRSWREIVELYAQAARGLAAAHAVGIVHRDFKPDNALVGNDGRVRVVDFGLARAADDETAVSKDEKIPSTPAALETPLTRTGALVGTPAYMAPEQLLSQPTDARTDQFSFCVALYHALYGQRPFGGDSLADLAYEVVQGHVREPPRGARVPAAAPSRHPARSAR